MTTEAPLGIADYPLSETRPDRVRSATGKPLNAMTVEAVVAGDVALADLAITPEALHQQAEIARAAGRAALALNFERAAEMVGMPHELVLSIYEMLRPGRAKDKGALLAIAAGLRRDYRSDALAAFLEEAADIYERRGLFAFRF